MALAQQPPSGKKLESATQEVLRKDGEDQCSYRAWLDEDIRWIISEPERAAFEHLSTDEERDQFVEQFWRRRDPTPDTVENEYKEEHYRRIAYANVHFGAVVPGWKNDRGRVYIVLGPPDEIDHPPPALVDRPQAERGNTPPAPPEDVWRYRYRKPTPRDEFLRHGPLKNVEADVILRFVDTCRCGDYRLVLDPSQKDLFNIPFRDERPSGLIRYPAVKFKELEEVVTHKIVLKRVPFEVTTDFAKVTRCTVQLPITLRINNHDITFVKRGDGGHATIHVHGRLTVLTGRIVETFEGILDVDAPPEALATTLEKVSVYQTQVMLFPGHYRLDLVVQDVNGDRVGTWYHGVVVPTPE